jgi:GntR family transcriptional regulator, transcriptional repressor for pyruvate dehydrogenase complex
MSLRFEPIPVEPTYRKVASALVEHIVAGRLKAGDHLPPELELARQFGVNRSTVREALRELDSAGLLGRRRGSKRMMVTRPGPGHVGAGIRRALVLHDVTFLDVWEALMILEPPLAAAAATRRSAADCELLAQAAHSVRDAQSSAQAVIHVAQFFRALGPASGNPALVLAQEPLIQLLEPSLAAMIDKVPQARARIVDAQRRLSAAVEARDSEGAQTWMAKHIRDFKRGYVLAGINQEHTVFESKRASRAGARAINNGVQQLA